MYTVKLPLFDPLSDLNEVLIYNSEVTVSSVPIDSVDCKTL